MSGSEAARQPAPGPTDAPAPPPGAPSRPRSYLAVAAALLLAVVALLGAGYLVDRQLRPRVGMQSPDATAMDATLPRPTPWPPVGRTPLEREVEDAYARYWEVRVQAYYTLDTSHLPEVMAGAELQREEEQIRGLASQGRRGRLVVEHRIRFLQVSTDQSSIYEEYVNRSYNIDSTKGIESRPDGPPPTVQVSFLLEKVGGSWKVVDGTLYD